MEPVRVLLADDHTLYRRGIRTLLEQMPDIEAVGEGSNGLEVVFQALELVPDAILMDIQMPELRGVEAARAIRDGEARAGGHTPIVALTAHAIKGNRELYLAAGMDDYISKPIRRAELYAAIRRHARRHEPSELPMT